MSGVSPTSTACVTSPRCCPPASRTRIACFSSDMFTHASTRMIQYADFGMRISECGLEVRTEFRQLRSHPPSIRIPPLPPQSSDDDSQRTYLHGAGSLHDGRRGVARRGLAARVRRGGL